MAELTAKDRARLRKEFKVAKDGGHLYFEARYVVWLIERVHQKGKGRAGWVKRRKHYLGVAPAWLLEKLKVPAALRK